MMPATTGSSVDPIGTMLQRTFGSIEAKREGLIRGGNSASATRPSFSMDERIQSSSKHSLLLNGNRNVNRNGSESSIQFDSPTRCKTSLSVPNSNQSKIVVLNPAMKSGLKCKAANR